MAINVMYQVPNSLIQQQRQAENRAYRRQMNLLQMQQNFQQSQAEANRQFQREQATTEYERQMERLATQQNFQMRQVASQREYEQSMMQNKMSAQMEFNRQQHLQDLEFRRQENEMNRDFQRERMEMQEQFMDKRAERQYSREDTVYSRNRKDRLEDVASERDWREKQQAATWEHQNDMLQNQYSREDTVYSRNRKDRLEDVASERDWREKQQAEQRMYEIRRMAQAAKIGEETRRQKMLDEASMLQYSMLNTHDFSDEQMSERMRLQQEIHDISEASLKGEITKQQGDDEIWKRRIQLETMTPSKLKNPQTQMNLKEQFEQESFVDGNGITWTRNPKGGWDATMPPKAAPKDDQQAKDREQKLKKAEDAWKASGGDVKRATKIYQDQAEFEQKILGGELGAKSVGSYF